MQTKYTMQKGRIVQETSDSEPEIVEELDEQSGKLIYVVKRRSPRANIQNISITE